eukprot:TRINITY_DN9782_c0_g1_i1.p1 TRINITY_DN9782_c0_g1~~TRINITY_DN9782_c0_g1_i1.p1  ORF type:complete len:210 (-),score=48.01 TRINITY_DN9782_c0_g1_i1:105-734(-)
MIALFLLAAFFAGVHGGQSECPTTTQCNAFVTLPGLDFQGCGDMTLPATPTVVATIQECCALCSNTTGCHGFTAGWFTWNGVVYCWPKTAAVVAGKNNSCAATVSKNGFVVSAYLPEANQPPTCDNYQLLSGQDFAGCGDIQPRKAIPVQTMYQCCDYCSKNKNCYGFSVGKRTTDAGPMCYLKNSTVLLGGSCAAKPSSALFASGYKR